MRLNPLEFMGRLGCCSGRAGPGGAGGFGVQLLGAFPGQTHALVPISPIARIQQKVLANMYV